MRKKTVGFIVAGVLVLVSGLALTPASAQLSLEVGGGYYSPNFGEINDELEEFNDLNGTDFELKAGMMYGLALGYDLNPYFGLRLEYNSFESRTSDDFWDHYVAYSDYWDLDLTLTVTPAIVSGIYRFSPFYVGAGVGLFSTEFKVTGVLESYEDEILYYSDSVSDSRSDNPVGILGLVGVEYRDEAFFCGLEARYVVAEAELKDWDLREILDTKVVLGGFQVCVTAGFTFK